MPSRGIEEIYTKLKKATGVERIDLLLEIARRLQRTDPTAAMVNAKKALDRAGALGEQSRFASALVILGHCHYYLSDHSAALESFRCALDKAHEAVAIAPTAAALHGIGLVQTAVGSFVEAGEALARARELIGDSDDPELIDRLGFVHNSTGVIYIKLGDYATALEHLHRSQSIFESNGNALGRAVSTGNIGQVHFALADMERAKELFSKVVTLSKLADDMRSEAINMLNLGLVEQRLGNLDEAHCTYQRTLELARILFDRPLEAYSESSIGTIYQERKEYDRALEHMHRAIEIAEAGGDVHQLMSGGFIGEIHLQRGEPERAVEVLLRVLRTAQSSGDRDSEFKLHETLSQCYEALHRPADALRHHRMYATIKDEVAGQKQQRELERMMIRTTLEQAERDREILRLEKEQLVVQVEHEAKQLTAMALHLAEKNQLLDSLREQMSKVVEAVEVEARPALRTLMRRAGDGITRRADWRSFEEQFEKVHHGFVTGLSKRYPELSRTEIRVCALLKTGLGTKEVAELMRANHRTVQNHRYHIRKKLRLSDETNLDTFIASL